MRRRPVAVVVAALVVGGCAGSTALPAAVEVTVAPTTTEPAPPQPECDAAEQAGDARRSFAPDGPLPAPGEMPPGSKMEAIRERGRLIAGVSADTLLFGSRNPFTTEIEGLDIDVIKELALAIFGGDPADIDSRIEYRVMTYAQRLPSLESEAVDVVAHTMTINCNRWLRINFSSQYYDAGQKALVNRGSGFTGVADLNDAGARVCTLGGGTSFEEMSNTERYPNVVVVVRPDVTDCLVAMQQGEADAITSDDTVLAGFVAQDPQLEVVGDAFTSEPYGLGFNKDDVELTRFANAVLENVRSSGRWAEIYTTWLLDTGALTGEAPEPPPALYGREQG
jgi:polar amino acid transport system substrate-binding protein